MSRTSAKTPVAKAPRQDVFEAYEALPSSYHKDPRWKQVHELRKKGEHLVANGLVFSIRYDYGFEG